MDGSEHEQLEQARARVAELEREIRAAQEGLHFFVYGAGHDLQQPLRAIGTYAQLLQREREGDERIHELTGSMLEGVKQANALITSLLVYARVGNYAGRAPVALAAPLQTALFALAKDVAAAEAEVRYSNLPSVPGDESALVTLFEKLLGNALKFRGTEPPRITVWSEESDGVQMIGVRDNGCGIAPEYCEKVFEPFKRLHGRDISGSGLGLAICRKIVEAHGGQIWIESDGRTGTEVKLTLPL